MKKIYSLLCAVAISTLAVAQSQLVITKPAPTKKAAYDLTKCRASKQNQQTANAKTTSGNQGWFNYGLAAEALYNAGGSSLNQNYLFPDSTMLGNFGGTFSGIWVHHLSEIVDFRSQYFGLDNSTSWVASAAPTSSVQVDSVSIFYGYTRVQTGVTDTLVFRLFAAPNTTVTGALATSGFITSNFPGGADTTSFKRMGYNQTKNAVAASSNTATTPTGMVVYKFPLTQADTAETLLREIAFKLPTPYVFAANQLFVAAVTFVPGYTYNSGDQIDNTANAFFFTSLEEMGDGGGAGTFFNFPDCNYRSPSCEYSSSQIVPQDVRYNLASAGTWVGRFIPAMAYTAPYGFEHHLISFHVTDDLTVGVKELTNNTFGMDQNVPNPFTKESTVKYTLAKDVNSAVFTVTDVMGRVISTESVNTTTGTHNVKLGAFASGVYYYSLNVDGVVITKKMIVE